MMKKVWPVLLAVVLVFGLALLGCGSSGGGGGGEGGEAFSFEGPFDYKLWGNNKPVYDETTKLLAFDKVNDSMGFFINFADIGYTYNSKDKLIFTYYVEVETPAAALLVKGVTGSTFADPSGSGGATYGQGKGWEYVLGDSTLSVHDGPLVAGTWDADTKTGTFEVLMGLFGSKITGIGFQHNPWCDMGGGGKIAENSKYKLKFLKVENGVSEIEVEPPVDPVDPDTVDWPEIPDAEKFAEYPNAGSAAWAIDQKLPFTYFIIASVGGGNADGFGGFQPAVQGNGVTQEIRTTGDWTSLAHTDTEFVYFVFDLSGYDNYSQVISEDGWKQFYINYGKAVLGTWQGYVVDGSKNAVTKPADAVEFTATADKEAAPGFVTKTIPTFYTDTSYHAVTAINYTGPVLGLVDEEITLAATVSPANATNKVIVWSCADANVTIDGDKFTASAAGTYTVVATITNGATESTDFVKNDISITISAPSGVVADDYSPDFSTLALVATDTWVSAGNSPVAAQITDGYSMTYSPAVSADYDNAYWIFTVEFDAGVTLSDYKKVTFDFKGISGDLSYKTIALHAFEDVPTAKTSAADRVTDSVSMGEITTANTTVPVTLTLDDGKTLALSGNTFYCTLFVSMASKGNVGGTDSPTVYEITNVVFTQDE